MKKNIFNLGLLLIAILPLIISFNFLYLKDPPVWPDEPVFYDMAKNLTTNNSLEARIYSGITSDVKTTGLGYPPLYFYALSYWTDVFGSNIETIRLLSLFVGIFSLSTFFFLSKLIFKNNYLATLGTILLSLDINFARSTRTGRMEIFTFFFMLLSFLFYILCKKKNRNIYYVLAGVTSGLAILTHPMGFIAPLIIGLNILITSTNLRKTLFHLFIFIMPIILALPFWILKSGNLFSLISTYGSHLQDKAPKIPYAFILFQTDFSWWLLLITYLIIFIVFIITFFKSKLFKEKYILVFFLSGFIISSLILFWGREGGYMLYFQPFITLMTLSLLNIYYKKSGFIFISILTLLLIFNYLNIQFFHNNNFAMTNNQITSIFDSQNFNYHSFTKNIIDVIPKHKANIFISSAPDPYFDLLKLNLYNFYEAPDPSFPILESDYKAVLDNSDFAIITWIPHKFLQKYIENNKENLTPVGQNNGYQAIVIKFVPKNKRI